MKHYKIRTRMKTPQNIRTKSIFLSKDIYLYIIIGLVTNEY
jgi:hypothetical protein